MEYNGRDFFYCLAPWLFTRIKSLDQAARFVLFALLINAAISFVLAHRPLIEDKAIWADFLFLYFPSQLPVFALGILLFFILRHPDQQLKGSTVLLGAGVLLLASTTNQFTLLPEHVRFGLGFLALALALSRYPVRILVNPFTRYVGKISFSLYLAHFAVLFLLERYNLADLLHPTSMRVALVDYALRFAIVLALASGIATFFYHVIEEPGQNLGKKLIARSEQRGLPVLAGLPFLAVVPLFFLHSYRPVPAGNTVYIQVGDSITFGQENTKGHSPGEYAVRALATPTTFIKLAYPGESAREFMALHRQELQDTLAAIAPGHRIILGIAYGANDLNMYPVGQAEADALRLCRWATETLHLKEVLLIPAMNRTDKFGFTREDDMSVSHHFNATREQYNAALRAEIQQIPGVRMADETDSPSMFAEAAPQTRPFLLTGRTPRMPARRRLERAPSPTA